MENLTQLGEKNLKTYPGPPEWGLDIGLATQFQNKNYAMKTQSIIAGWVFGKRTIQRKRMKAMEFNIAI